MVYLNFNTLSCQNYYFQRVWGVYIKLVEIPEWWGSFLCSKTWKFRGGEGDLHEIPSVVGVWIFNSGTKQYYLACTKPLMLSVYINIPATMIVRASWAVRMP